MLRQDMQWAMPPKAACCCTRQPLLLLMICHDYAGGLIDVTAYLFIIKYFYSSPFKPATLARHAAEAQNFQIYHRDASRLFT